MIELLNSNYLPVKTQNKEFEKMFFKQLEDSNKILIASGYISEDSVADLLGLYKSGFQANLDLIVGMHYFEGFSTGQYNSLKDLSCILQYRNLGDVYLASSVKYHGKVYLFEKNTGEKISILGSSNLTKINPFERIYDTDIITDEIQFINNVENFLTLLKSRNCEKITSIDSSRVKIIQSENLFDDYLSVRKVDNNRFASVLKNKTNISFDIALKTEEKSNLNVYFGKGRKNFSNGAIIPRSWYEVEIIVSKSITSLPNYPKKDAIFTVITDDGYEFKCKTSGDFSKNFRSTDDLKILGRWIKGRMENAGALNIGEMVTDEVLKKYGRNTVTLTQTLENDVWFLDFGVK